MAAYKTAIVRLRSWAPGRPTVGLGLLVGASELVTCAHVVNAAMGRGLREQAQPGESDLVQVEFPLLPESPVRLARVVKWMPPPSRAEGGDVAGLMLTEVAPGGAWPARFAAAAPEPGTRLRVFGYPGRPPRDGGMWVDLDLKGEVGGRSPAATIRTASGRYPHSLVISATAWSPDCKRGRAVWMNRSAASPGCSVPRLIGAASSSAASRRRLVISTAQSAVPGISGRT